MSNNSYPSLFSNDNGRFLSPIVAQSYGLPDPRQFALDAYQKAFPQVVAWSAAVAGVLLVSLIVKSFLSRG